MRRTLQGRSLLTLKDYSSGEIRTLLDRAVQVKKERQKGERLQRFTGRTLALIFEKRSTRTRCAFETAFGEEGGHPVFLSVQDIQLGAKESIEDTARVLGRMFDGIQFRGYDQKTVEILSAYSGVPVYNGLTDAFHPTQALADLMTIEESFGKLKGTNIVFVGDGRNNVAYSLMIGCAKMGSRYTALCPESLQPDKDVLAYCRETGKESGAEIQIVHDPSTGVDGADVIYTDVWASMGEEDKMEERKAVLRPYQVTAELMGNTGNDKTVFMHCLPAVKGNEVTAEVIDGPQSKAWDQAENRKHTIKALMLETMA